MKLSVLIPYICEYPQIVFTIRAIHEELAGIPHEIVCIDNWHPTNAKRGFKPDRAHEMLVDGKIKESMIYTFSKKNDWLKYLRYDGFLSHWQAKDYAVANIDTNLFLFIDSHVVPARGSLTSAYCFYLKNHKVLNGTMGMPLTYYILDENRLEYRMVFERENWYLGYLFDHFHQSKEPVKEVAAHSMCGCWMTRDIYDSFGGWGRGFSVYGGGENLMNYVLSVLGHKHWMWQGGSIHHHGERRGYEARQEEIVGNRAIAAYLYGGNKWLRNYLLCSHLPDRQQIEIEEGVRFLYEERRKLINNRQVFDIESIISKWLER